MNRREVVKYGLGAVGVVTVPITFSKFAEGARMVPAKAYSETESTLKLRRQLRGYMEKFDNGGRRLDALSADEWDQMATAHLAYWTAHAQLGNVHSLDLSIKENEVYLKHRFPAKVVEIDNIIKWGCYAFMSWGAVEYHKAAEKMRVERPQSAVAAGHLVEAIYFPNCTDAWTSFALLFGILALLLTPAGPFELVYIFSVLAVTNDAVGMFTCR